MAKSSSNSSGSGFGALGFTSTVATIIAFCKTPSFVGLAGFGKALLVGAGTSMGAAIVAAPAAIAGFVTGGLVGLVTGSKKAAVVMGMVGAAAGGIGGGVYGAFRGYDFAKDSLVQVQTMKNCAPGFNAAATGSNDAVDAAPVAAPRAQLAYNAPRF